MARTDIVNMDDGDPVMRSVPEVELTKLMTAAWECAEDLEHELDARYPSRHEQPVQQRRYEQNMDVVRRLRHAYKTLEF